MDELKRKILELENENETLRLKLDTLQKPRAPLGIVHEQQEAANSHILREGSPENLQNHPCPDESLSMVLNYLKTILGYNIEQFENRFILRSVYAFCEEDVFEIEISNSRLIFKNTEYLAEHQEAFNTYVRTGKSYCAFFAAVTIDLFNKKTFG